MSNPKPSTADSFRSSDYGRTSEYHRTYKQEPTSRDYRESAAYGPPRSDRLSISGGSSDRVTLSSSDHRSLLAHDRSGAPSLHAHERTPSSVDAHSHHHHMERGVLPSASDLHMSSSSSHVHTATADRRLMDYRTMDHASEYRGSSGQQDRSSHSSGDHRLLERSSSYTDLKSHIEYSRTTSSEYTVSRSSAGGGDHQRASLESGSSTSRLYSKYHEPAPSSSLGGPQVGHNIPQLLKIGPPGSSSAAGTGEPHSRSPTAPESQHAHTPTSAAPAPSYLASTSRHTDLNGEKGGAQTEQTERRTSQIGQQQE